MGILPLESKDNTILIVHPDSVLPGAIAAQGMKAVTGRYPEGVQVRYQVDLIQLPPDHWPQRLRNPTGRLAAHAVPNVLRCGVRERTDHALAF
jgi:hypothetical protein